MRAVRVTIGTMFAAILLTLCIGLQVLEATGQWDRTFQDSGDEASIIVAVLCIGTALVVASRRYRASLSAIQSPSVAVRSMQRLVFVQPIDCPVLGVSPPLSLRI